MNSALQNNSRSKGAGQYLFMSAAGLGILLGWRYVGQRQSLWQDEISALTHGLQPWGSFVVEIIRNEIHPFVYFAFLKFYQQLFASDDRGLLLSSLVLQVLALISFAWVARREFGSSAAGVGAIIYASLPVFAAQAGNLRMYALVTLLVILCWGAQRELLRSGKLSLAIASFVLQLLAAYAHVVGFLFVVLLAICARWSMSGSTVPLGERRWIQVQLATVIAMSPLPLLALLRGGPKLDAVRGLDLLIQPATLMLPWSASGVVEWAYALSLVALLLVALINKPTRMATIAFPLFAWGISSGLAWLGKPIYRNYVFAAYLLPLICLFGGAALSSLLKAGGIAVAVAASVLSSFYVWSAIPGNTPSENYQPAAHFLAEHIKSGDVVVVEHYDVYWGVLRYCVGPNWGEPLSEMSQAGGEKWKPLISRLGPKWAKRLHLIPDSDEVVNRGVEYVFGLPTRSGIIKPGHTLWFVAWSGDPKPMHVPPGTAPTVLQQFGNELQVGTINPIRP